MTVWPTRLDDMLTRRDLSSNSSSGRLLSQLSSLLNFVALTSEADSTSPSSVCGGLVGKRGRVAGRLWVGLVAPSGRKQSSLFWEARRGMAVREVDGGSMVYVREVHVGEWSCRTGAAGTFLSNALERILRQLSNYASIGEACSRDWTTGT